jgi:hypothetical protein
MVHALNSAPATMPEITEAWYAVHSDPKCAGLGWRYAATLTDLRLPQDGMTALALEKLDENEGILAKRCATWDVMPACAQMAMHSLAWACGAGAQFPRLFAALDVHDYEAAAVEIHMNEYTPEGIHNAGLVPRNKANAILMRNAARVEAYHLDPDYLNWDSLITQDDVPTEPEFPHTSFVIDEPTNAASLPTCSPPRGSKPT